MCAPPCLPEHTLPYNTSLRLALQGRAAGSAGAAGVSPATTSLRTGPRAWACALGALWQAAILLLLLLAVALARKHHRLALCLCAAYGHSAGPPRSVHPARRLNLQVYVKPVSVSLQDHVQEFPRRWWCAWTRTCCWRAAAWRRPCSWPRAWRWPQRDSASPSSSWVLLAAICFCLAYCGLSLAVHVYCSAV
jgi:hypothetical protein